MPRSWRELSARRRPRRSSTSRRCPRSADRGRARPRRGEVNAARDGQRPGGVRTKVRPRLGSCSCLDGRGLRPRRRAADDRRRARSHRSRRTRPRRRPPRSPASRPRAQRGSTSSSRARSSTRGPGRDERFAVGSWTRQIARARGRGRRRAAGRRPLRRARPHATCATSAALTGCSSTRRCRAGTYNVASGRKVRAAGGGRAARRVSRSARSRSSADPARLRPSELPVVWGDPSKLEAATGWEPRSRSSRRWRCAWPMLATPSQKGWRSA